ncbi:hypothetical protein AAC387_Pa06g0375 [Persea americana]
MTSVSGWLLHGLGRVGPDLNQPKTWDGPNWVFFLNCLCFRTETAAQSPSSSSAVTTGGQPDCKAATTARQWNSGDGDRAGMDGGWWTVMDRPDSLPFPVTTVAMASLFSDDAEQAATEDSSVRRWLRRQCEQRQTSVSSNPDRFGTFLCAQIWPTEIQIRAPLIVNLQ